MIGGTHSELSPTMQDYLKVLFQLEERGERLTNSAVAAARELSAASVSTMMKNLAKKGCVSYSPYQEIQLTKKGRDVALEMTRHHRILETFLVNVLGMNWDEVHEEAERLEHHISEALESRMAAVMNNPKFDPHGHPIPGPKGELATRTGMVALRQMKEGQAGTVREVSDANPEALRYLSEQGIGISTAFVLERIHPFDGPLELSLDNRQVVLSRSLAERVLVEIAPT
ncbi:metal-dependent transcriptional regulator [bacterium AH-315-M10]|nr:metal-dependent transcriptional regulator [bacterium AH-315-M10]